MERRLQRVWLMLLCLSCAACIFIVQLNNLLANKSNGVSRVHKGNPFSKIALYEAVINPQREDPPSCMKDLLDEDESSRIREENINTFIDFKKSIKEKYRLCLEKTKLGITMLYKPPYMWRKYWEPNSTVSECKVDNNKLKMDTKPRFSSEPPSYDELKQMYPEVYPGGFYPGPEDCKPTHSTVIIIPFRNRHLHLRYWLYYMIRILLWQKIRFSVVVVEQDGVGIFNKGQLMNTGYMWAKRNLPSKWNCFIFHDVDMISEIPSNMYTCRKDSINHLSWYTDKFYYYTIFTGVTVGGAVGMTGDQYESVNGYTNIFYGWGGEDDDMYARLLAKKYEIVRPNDPSTGKFAMIQHGRDPDNNTNPRRFRLLKNSQKRMKIDGLSNLATNVTAVLTYPLFTKIKVQVVPQSEVDYGAYMGNIFNKM